MKLFLKQDFIPLFTIIANGMLYTLLLRFSIESKLLDLKGIYISPPWTVVIVFAMLAEAIFILYLLVGLIIAFFKKEKKMRWVTLLVNILVFAGFILLLSTTSLNPPTILHSDARRVSDLRTVGAILALYYEKFNSYPLVNGTSDVSRWQQMEKAIIYSGLDINNMPQDNKFPVQSYDYKNSDNGESFVLKALLINSHFRNVLDNDIDGMIFGIDCGVNSPAEREYCVAGGK